MKKLVVIAIIAVAAWYFTRSKTAATPQKKDSTLLKSGIIEGSQIQPSGESTADPVTTQRSDDYRTYNPREGASSAPVSDGAPTLGIPNTLMAVFSDNNKPKSAFQQ